MKAKFDLTISTILALHRRKILNLSKEMFSKVYEGQENCNRVVFIFVYVISQIEEIFGNLRTQNFGHQIPTI